MRDNVYRRALLKITDRTGQYNKDTGKNKKTKKFDSGITC